MSQSQAEQLARELAREAGFLPERWRAWLLAELRKNFEAYDQEQHRIDQLNQRMSEAVEALERVAKHLRLKGKKAKLALTIREFDAAPESVRKDWTGRRVAESVRGSWRLAKSVAFTDQRLPVFAERQAQQRQQIARKRREAAFTLASIQDWLTTNPSDKSKQAYTTWAKTQNQTRSAEKKPLPLGWGIWRRWGLPWSEIVEAVERNEVPGDDEQPELEPELEASEAKPSEDDAPASIDRNYVLDSEHRGQLIRSTREARGWTVPELAKRAGVESSNLAKVERNKISNPSFETILKLAIALGLPLDAFAITD